MAVFENQVKIMKVLYPEFQSINLFSAILLIGTFHSEWVYFLVLLKHIVQRSLSWSLKDLITGFSVFVVELETDGKAKP